MQALLLSLTTAALTLILHSISIARSLYWTYWWFDIITHALGGFAMGMLAAVLCSKKERGVGPVTISLLLLLLIGWEVFEVAFIGIETKGTKYMIGTFLDILIGMISAWTAICIYSSKGRTD